MLETNPKKGRKTINHKKPKKAQKGTKGTKQNWGIERSKPPPPFIFCAFCVSCAFCG
jgi:hypothetical protein